MRKLTDDNGIPTVEGAQAMFNAVDEAAEKRREQEERRARFDAMSGNQRRKLRARRKALKKAWK